MINKIIDVIFDIKELFIINDKVRQEQQSGKEWDKDFQLKIMAAILEGLKNNPENCVVKLSEEELWLITRQVPITLMYGNITDMGIRISQKVYPALLSFHNLQEDWIDNVLSEVNNTAVTEIENVGN